MIATCLRAKMVGSTRGLFRLGFRITAAWPLARQSICQSLRASKMQQESKGIASTGSTAEEGDNGVTTSPHGPRESLMILCLM